MDAVYPATAAGMTRILIVEDEAPIREGLVDHLGREGFRVTAAASLEEGLARLEINPDLVVLDRTMPDVSGDEACARIRALREDVRIVMMSGYSRERASERTRAASSKSPRPNEKPSSRTPRFAPPSSRSRQNVRPSSSSKSA